MANKSDPIVALLSSHKLQCYDIYTEKDASIDLSTLIQFGEFVDQASFIKHLTDFFKLFDIQGRTVLFVYSSEQIFGGEVDIAGANIDVVRNVFLETIPLEPSQMRLYELRQKSKVSWLVVNYQLFHAFEQIVTTTGGQFKEVLPHLVIPRVATILSLNKNTVQQLLREKNIRNSDKYVLSKAGIQSVASSSHSIQMQSQKLPDVIKRFFANKFQAMVFVLGTLLVLLVLLLLFVYLYYRGI